MRVRFSGVERAGQAVDLRDVDVTPEEVVCAVRRPDDSRVACGRPGVVHERVGFLHRGVSVAVVAAVADAARSRGATAAVDAEMRRVESELADVAVPPVDLESARARVADTASSVAELRERVARASGRVEAWRDAGDAADAEADLREAARRLADAETTHHAAREELAAARAAARVARDERERRLALEDRLENLRRAARRALAAEYAASFRRAVASLPVPGEPAPPGSFAGPDWTAACAVARIARVRAPLVVSTRVFDQASRARAALDAPVLLVEV